MLVVVGDVEPREVIALAEKHFGAIKARPLPARKPQDEPPQLGVKRVTVKAPAELPYVLMVFRAPALRDPEKDWEPYALEMLAAALDGQRGGAAAAQPGAHRAPRQLRRARPTTASPAARACSTSAATPAPGKTAAEVGAGTAARDGRRSSRRA